MRRWQRRVPLYNVGKDFRKCWATPSASARMFRSKICWCLFPPAPAPKLVHIFAGRIKIGAFFRRPPESWCLFSPATYKLVPISADHLKVGAYFRRPSKSRRLFPPPASKLVPIFSGRIKVGAYFRRPPPQN